MRYKNMTVCLDNSAESSQRLDFSLALAVRHGAHLTALYLTYVPFIMSDSYAVWAPMMLEWEDLAKTQQERARESFYATASKAGINFDWAGYRSFELQKIIAHARVSDLTIIGQRNPADVESDRGNGYPERLILKLGRPVLILPYAGEIPKTFDNIFVAWDGGREDTRAMADALPFLRLAQQVKVLTIYESADQENDLPDIDIAGYLAKHDVKVEIERNQSIHIAPADWLLSRAKEIHADLLVMGAYGHYRLTELVLGSVTQAIMRQMTLPVLMSH